jgi:hypothetical protein
LNAASRPTSGQCVTADQLVDPDFYAILHPQDLRRQHPKKIRTFPGLPSTRPAVPLFSGLALCLRLTGTPQLLSSKRWAFCGEVDFEV